MNRTLFSSFIIVAGLAWSMVHAADPEIGKTARYCNPLPIPTAPGASASGDVTVIQENGKYYMFCTGGGAWVSEDLVNWEYHPVQGRVPVAPGIIKYKNYFYMSGNGAPLYRAKDILGPYESAGDWKTHDGQVWTGTAGNGRVWEGAFDVHFFIDNDKPYLFYPGRGTEGIYAVPLDPDDLSRFAAAPKHLFGFDKSHVWERYGEMNEYPDVSWIEGPWMIKHNNTYYLEYSANGTQWFAYATGVYTAKSPIGPFAYAPGNPILRKTTGIVTGSGHGCVIKGPDGNHWQFYTIVLANPPGGRRIGMDPVGFDEQGNMFVNGPSETPQWAPGAVKDPARRNDSGSIPLTINKMRAWRAKSSFSSERPGREAAYAVDNAGGTWWEPDTTDAMPALTIELSPATEFDPVQLFTIDGVRLMFRGARRGFGRRSTTPPPPEIYQYRIDVSMDGETYNTALDLTQNTIPKNTIFEEIPPVKCRFVRLTITDWPKNASLGILEFTVFGRPAGFLSSAVPNPDTASSGSSQMDGIRIVSKLSI